MKCAVTGLFVLLVSVFACESALAQTTIVPGHKMDRFDQDNNGYADEGVVVNGHYTSVYAYDDLGDWYWDLGDGRIQGTVENLEDLDLETLTICDYVVNYRGTYENDPFLDSGWIMNNIRCYGYAVDMGLEAKHYKFLIVHESDPRYTGDPDWAVWGTWEYFGYVVSGEGQLARPKR